MKENEIRDGRGISSAHRADHNEPLMGTLASHVTGPIAESDAGWQEVKERAWSEAVKEKFELMDDS